MRFNFLTLSFTVLSVAIFAAAAPSSDGSNARVARKIVDPEGIPNIYGRDTAASSAKVERDDFLVDNTLKTRESTKDVNVVDLAARQSKIAVFFWVEFCDFSGNDCTGRIDLINEAVECFQKPSGKTTLKFHRSGYFYSIDFALHTNYIIGLCLGLIQSTQIINNPSNGQVVEFEASSGVNYFFTKL